jgi:hypothetical protein
MEIEFNIIISLCNVQTISISVREFIAHFFGQIQVSKTYFVTVNGP